MTTADDIHDFQVTAVELADDPALDGIAIVLTDRRGGKVRLHLTEEMAERLRAQASMALEGRQGP